MLKLNALSKVKPMTCSQEGNRTCVIQTFICIIIDVRSKQIIMKRKSTTFFHSVSNYEWVNVKEINSVVFLLLLNKSSK